MQTISTAFDNELRKLIENRIETLKEQISLGHVPHMEAYKALAGQVQAYREVLEMCEEVKSELSKR